MGIKQQQHVNPRKNVSELLIGVQRNFKPFRLTSDREGKLIVAISFVNKQF